MATDAEKIQANREYFAHKLQAEKQRDEVLHSVQGTDPFDFVLLDTRGRPAFVEGHIPGAWCVAAEDLDKALSQLPKDKAIVSYCWSHD
jgi:rhodanese-related sulfurtransferase